MALQPCQLMKEKLALGSSMVSRKLITSFMSAKVVLIDIAGTFSQV